MKLSIFAIAAAALLRLLLLLERERLRRKVVAFRSHMDQWNHSPPTAFHLGVSVQLPMTVPSQWVWITGSVEVKMAMAAF